MFRKIKFMLLTVVLGTGISSCSSDDSASVVVPEGKEYLVTVTVTEDASINKIMGVVYDGKNVKNDVIDDLKETAWSKVYHKTEQQKISFTAQGLGGSKESKMEIKVTLDGEMVGEAFALGESLNATVVIHEDKKEKK